MRLSPRAFSNMRTTCYRRKMSGKNIGWMPTNAMDNGSMAPRDKHWTCTYAYMHRGSYNWYWEALINNYLVSKVDEQQLVRDQWTPALPAYHSHHVIHKRFLAFRINANTYEQLCCGRLCILLLWSLKLLLSNVYDDLCLLSSIDSFCFMFSKERCQHKFTKFLNFFNFIIWL